MACNINFKGGLLFRNRQVGQVNKIASLVKGDYIAPNIMLSVAPSPAIGSEKKYQLPAAARQPQFSTRVPQIPSMPLIPE